MVCHILDKSMIICTFLIKVDILSNGLQILKIIFVN